MKKLIAMLLVAAFVFSTVGCGGDAPKKDDKPKAGEKAKEGDKKADGDKKTP